MRTHKHTHTHSDACREREWRGEGEAGTGGGRGPKKVGLPTRRTHARGGHARRGVPCLCSAAGSWAQTARSQAAGSRAIARHAIFFRARYSTHCSPVPRLAPTTATSPLNPTSPACSHLLAGGTVSDKRVGVPAAVRPAAPRRAAPTRGEPLLPATDAHRRRPMPPQCPPGRGPSAGALGHPRK